jgi:hypothetical protein
MNRTNATEVSQQQSPEPSNSVNEEGLSRRSRSETSIKDRLAQRNRRNSLKSTGPKTPEGKKWSARNSLKHGFFAKYLLIPHPDAGEDPGEYNEWFSAICEGHKPFGFQEEFWAGQIAVWSWRLRRFIRYESGQIARILTDRREDLEQLKTEQGSVAVPTDPEMDSMVDHLLLPSDTDKLIRYEAIITRRLDHAIAALERLQLRRTADSNRSPLGSSQLL